MSQDSGKQKSARNQQNSMLKGPVAAMGSESTANTNYEQIAAAAQQPSNNQIQNAATNNDDHGEFSSDADDDKNDSQSGLLNKRPSGKNGEEAEAEQQKQNKKLSGMQRFTNRMSSSMYKSARSLLPSSSKEFDQSQNKDSQEVGTASTTNVIIAGTSQVVTTPCATTKPVKLAGTARHMSITSSEVIQLPKTNAPGSINSNNLLKGNTMTTLQTPTAANLNTISQSNTSMNTSTNRIQSIDEEDNLDLSSDEDAAQRGEETPQIAIIGQCSNNQFVKHNDCISKSKYRTIHRGLDNESGCEIAWTTYPLHNYKRDRLLKALDQVKKIGQTQDSENQAHKRILQVLYNEVRTVDSTKHLSAAAQQHMHLKCRPSFKSSRSDDFNLGKSTASVTTAHDGTGGKHEELIVISELITAGSIREYLKKLKPRLNVIKGWCSTVLEALQFLHQRDIVHGELSCETIYINSNNGEIKVGDVGIKHIHTSIRSHELGKCKQYVKEKDTLGVDVYCFGLTLLEIVSATESGSGRFTLKYIINMLNLGQKDSMLDTLLIEQMKEFISGALEEDPARRFSVDDLLNHEFLVQAPRNKSTTQEQQYTNGMFELHREQESLAKRQKAQHQLSKNSNSLQLSVLNDSAAQKKQRSSNKKKTTKMQKQNSNDQSVRNDEQRKQPAKMGVTTSTVDSQITANNATSNDKVESQQQPVASNSAAVKPYQFTQPEPVKTDTKMVDIIPNIHQANGTKIIAKDTSIEDQDNLLVISQRDQPILRQETQEEHNVVRGSTQKSTALAHIIQTEKMNTALERANADKKKQQVKSVIKGKTMTALPRNKQQISCSNQTAANFFQHLRGAEKGTSYKSANAQSTSRRSRKFSMPVAGSEATEPLNSIARQQSHPQQVPSPSSVPNAAEMPHVPSIQDNEQNMANSVNVDYQDAPESSTQTQQTRTVVSDNIIQFRIQIMMKGRKSDVKFPFDLTTDTPLAVANELKEHFEQNSECGATLPACLVEAICVEIQNGIDSHNSLSTNQQPTVTDASQAAQTQHSYQNTIVFAKQADKRASGGGGSGSKKQPTSLFAAASQRKPSAEATNEETKTVEAAAEEEDIASAQPYQNYPADALRNPQQTPFNYAAEDGGLISKRQQELHEEQAWRQEQEEMELQLAHDYLSHLPQIESMYYETSLPILETSGYGDTPEQMAASLQAEINQLMKDGLLDEEEYNKRMQQARRKVSISHNSNEQNRQHPTYYCYNMNNEESSNSIMQHHRPIAPPDLIEEPATETSAAVIEFEPQIPHNNTTGERHAKMIQEQQKNGPVGRQDILLYRNSIEYNDPDLINFMHNPDEDLLHSPMNNRPLKDRKGSQVDSDKSEAQESLWLLRELFPGYMEQYHFDNYEQQRQQQSNHHHGLGASHHLQGSGHQPPHHTGQSDMHTSQQQVTIDLSCPSLEASSSLNYCWHLDNKDLPHQIGGGCGLQTNAANEPPFQSDLSVILHVKGAHIEAQTGTMLATQNMKIPKSDSCHVAGGTCRNGVAMMSSLSAANQQSSCQFAAGGTGVSSTGGGQHAHTALHHNMTSQGNMMGDSSSQQIMMIASETDLLDEAQANKNVAQQAASMTKVHPHQHHLLQNHASFDFSESIIHLLTGTITKDAAAGAGGVNNNQGGNKTNVATMVSRPPSGQSFLHTHNQGVQTSGNNLVPNIANNGPLPQAIMLNNSQQYHNPVNFATNKNMMMQSFPKIKNWTRQDNNTIGCTITEMPSNNNNNTNANNLLQQQPSQSQQTSGCAQTISDSQKSQNSLKNQQQQQQQQQQQLMAKTSSNGGTHVQHAIGYDRSQIQVIVSGSDASSHNIAPQPQPRQGMDVLGEVVEQLEAQQQDSTSLAGSSTQNDEPAVAASNDGATVSQQHQNSSNGAGASSQIMAENSKTGGMGVLPQNVHPIVQNKQQSQLYIDPQQVLPTRALIRPSNSCATQMTTAQQMSSQLYNLPSITRKGKSEAVHPSDVISELPLRLTPSVVDIAGSQSQKQAETALNKAVYTQSSGLTHKLINTQLSIKGFPVMVEEEQKLQQRNDPAGSVAIPATAAHQSQQQPAKKQSKPAAPRKVSSFTDEENSSMASPLLRFSKQAQNNNSTLNNTTTSGSSGLQDLQRLIEIRSKGMLSDKIVRGYSHIYKSDVQDLKFALNLLELCSNGASVQPGGSAPATVKDSFNNLSISLDKSSASLKNNDLARFDDHFDKKTRRLVRKFKKREGLAADSQVDRDTWDCIIEAAIEKARKYFNVKRFQLESVQELKEDEIADNGKNQDDDDEQVHGDVESRQNDDLVDDDFFHAGPSTQLLRTPSGSVSDVSPPNIPLMGIINRHQSHQVKLTGRFTQYEENMVIESAASHHQTEGSPREQTPMSTGNHGTTGNKHQLVLQRCGDQTSEQSPSAFHGPPDSEMTGSQKEPSLMPMPVIHFKSEEEARRNAVRIRHASSENTPVFNLHGQNNENEMQQIQLHFTTSTNNEPPSRDNVAGTHKEI